MTISFLIPTYNYECVELVKQLASQSQKLIDEHVILSDFEILVGDDASTNQETINKNKEINTINRCRVIEHSHNLGRALLRNELGRSAKFEFLVFLDSDVKIISPDFVLKYARTMTSGNKVICGGIKSIDIIPSSSHSLRFLYELNADKYRDIAHRQRNPYMPFTTQNVAVERALFLSILFDENIKQYGYEDTQFCIQLKLQGIKILHIDNTLLHVGIDTNIEFLDKTETALYTLSTLSEQTKQEIKISGTYNRLRKMGLAPLYSWFFHKFRRPMRLNLLGPNPSLFVFKLYKLGYYQDILKQKKDK